MTPNPVAGVVNFFKMGGEILASKVALPCLCLMCVLVEVGAHKGADALTGSPVALCTCFLHLPYFHLELGFWV